MFYKLPQILALAASLASFSPSYADSLGQSVESFGDSIIGGFENLGQQLNRANSSFLNSIGGNNNSDNYEAQMRLYREQENARINEMSAVTGVSPDTLRQMRADGMTWEQIANKYNVNLDNLPLPPGVPQN